MNINYSEFEVVKPVCRKPVYQVISIFEDGSFRPNSELVKSISASSFEILLQKTNASKIILNPNGKVKIQLVKGNTIKNYDILSKLKKQKVRFPVYYVGEWDDESEVWVGELSTTNPNKTGGKIKK